MRTVGSILVLLGLGAAALFYYRTSVDSLVTSSNALQRLDAFKAQLAQQRNAQSVSVESWIDRKKAEELYSPEALLPHWHLYNTEEVQALSRYSESCLPESRLSRLKDPSLRKAYLYSQAKCEKRTLPVSFFATAPFLHPSGQSYSKIELDKNSGRTVLRDFLHILEVPESSRPKPALDPQGLDYLKRGENAFRTSEFLFLRKSAGTAEMSAVGRYTVLPLVEAVELAKHSGFKIETSSRPEFCLVKEGNLCWGWVPEKLNTRLTIVLLFGVGAIGVALVFSLMVLARLLRERKIEQQRRQFILETLTHELRTPLQTVQFLIERMRGDFDGLPKRSQEIFLELCTEFQRLSDLTRMSTRYIKDGKPRLLDEQREPVQVRDFLLSITERYGRDVVIETDEGLNLRLDPFWTTFCVRNLIENAFRYGNPPVRLIARLEGEVFTILVEDMGNGFSKSSKEEGMGIGLKLVQQVMGELGGSLELLNSPTRAFLRFQKGLS